MRNAIFEISQITELLWNFPLTLCILDEKILSSFSLVLLIFEKSEFKNGVINDEKKSCAWFVVLSQWHDSSKEESERSQWSWWVGKEKERKFKYKDKKTAAGGFVCWQGLSNFEASLPEVLDRECLIRNRYIEIRNQQISIGFEVNCTVFCVCRDEAHIITRFLINIKLGSFIYYPWVLSHFFYCAWNSDSNTDPQNNDCDSGIGNTDHNAGMWSNDPWCWHPDESYSTIRG